MDNNITNIMLYKRNITDQPIYWNVVGSSHNDYVKVMWGVVGKKQNDYKVIVTNGSVSKTIEQLVAAKRKEGYITFDEVNDKSPAPFTDNKLLYNFLAMYLPPSGCNTDGSEAVMLAKTFDPDKAEAIFKGKAFVGQQKLNGERCRLLAIRNSSSLFNPITLKLISRTNNEFIYIPQMLKDEIIRNIPYDLMTRMLDGEFCPDGELYIPGRLINEINHIIKSPDMYMPEKMLLQYWMYDITMDGLLQRQRFELLDDVMPKELTFSHLATNATNMRIAHTTNKQPFIYLGHYTINTANADRAISLRDFFIQCGFEGLILRDLDKPYQFGKRNLTMIKYKSLLEGKFRIIDIVPEEKRPKCGKLVLKNDINDYTFECAYAAPLDIKALLLTNKADYIGAAVSVEYRERSGVKELPFHAVALRMR